MVSKFRLNTRCSASWKASRALVFAALCTPNLALAQAYPEQERTYRHNDGWFYNRSFVTPQSDGGFSAHYLVCNLEDGRGLIFEWDSPNIRMGSGGRLAPEKCGGIRRSTGAIERDDGATISFTQAARRWIAPAYVSKVDLGVDLPRFLDMEYRKYFLPEGSETTISEFDTSIPPSFRYIQQHRIDGDRLRLDVSWDRGTVTLVVDEDFFFGEPFESIRSQLEEQGLAARTGTLRELVPEPEVNIPSERLDQQVIQIENPDGIASSFSISFPDIPQAISNGYVTFVDTIERRVIFDAGVPLFGR